MYLADESLHESRIRRELDGLYLPHNVPMVILVAVVISEHTTVVHRTASQVDVRQAIGNDLPILKPDLLFQQRPLFYFP